MMTASTAILHKWSMAEVADKFSDLAEKLSALAGVNKSRMFGFESITVLRKTFALMDEGSMVVKLGTAERAEAMNLDDAALWNPFGHEKKEWVRISYRHAGDWEKFAVAAMEYVKSKIEAAV
ncbi:MAG: hypothetical protein OEZ02_15845 [Anaerolineae bacterium]|nr:hypothetical protein [Anaerolineae bacterium]